MDRLENLRQEREKLVAEGGTILDIAEKENRDPTDVQNKRLDGIDDRVAEINGHIVRAERHRETERAIAAASAIATGVTGLDDMAAVSRERTVDVEAPPTPFQSMGEYLIAVAKFEMSNKQLLDPGLTALQDWQTAVAATGASEGTPSDGGFMVQTDLASEVFRGITTGGEILPRVRRIPIGPGRSGIKINAIDETSRVDGSRWGGIRAYWVEEATAATATKPKFRQIELDLKKLMGLFYATDELLEDAAALGQIALDGFTDELRFKVEDALFNGDGSGKPQGVLNCDAAISVAKESGQAADTVVHENVQKMWERLPIRSRPNAVWMINQEVERALNGMTLSVGTGGVPVYMPPNGVVDSPWGRLMGRPVIPIEYASALGDKGDINLIDWGSYLMIDKGSMKWDASMHVQFTTNEMTFRMVWRVDGQPTIASALTPFKGANTLSPFINLAERA